MLLWKGSRLISWADCLPWWARWVSRMMEDPGSHGWGTSYLMQPRSNGCWVTPLLLTTLYTHLPEKGFRL